MGFERYRMFRKLNGINGLREIRAILPLSPPPKGGSRNLSFEHGFRTQNSHSFLKEKAMKGSVSLRVSEEGQKEKSVTIVTLFSFCEPVRIRT